MITAVLLTTMLAPPRTIEWSGYKWQVKRAMERKVGPGPNLFSDSEDSVFVDKQGRLHLRVRKTDKGWTSSEVYLNTPFGYGTYTFEVDSPAIAVDNNMVLGLFTYGESEEYAHREIDFEIARWSDPKAHNFQFVVQPYDKEGNMIRFELPERNPNSLHTFTWRPDRIDFLTKSGTFSKSWTYKGKDLPAPGDETVHINLWMFEGKPPTTGETHEIVIKRFTYRR